MREIWCQFLVPFSGILMAVLLVCSAPPPQASTPSLQPPPHYGTVPVSTSTQHTATSTVQYSAVQLSKKVVSSRPRCEGRLPPSTSPASVGAVRGGTPGPGTAARHLLPLVSCPSPHPWLAAPRWVNIASSKHHTLGFLQRNLHLIQIGHVSDVRRCLHWAYWDFKTLRI